MTGLPLLTTGIGVSAIAVAVFVIGVMVGSSSRMPTDTVVYSPVPAVTRDQPREAVVRRVVRAIDGDTVVLEDGERVRYIGIDAPEFSSVQGQAECFGREAAARNRELVEGQLVRLERDQTDRDRFGRLLRYLHQGDRFINEQLVSEGYARASAYPPDLARQATIAAAETLARKTKRGLWSTCSATPPSSTSLATSTSGLIKGNISARGDRLYHRPDCASYAVTVVDPAKGERWFTSEDEAVAAGWRVAATCPR